MEMKEIPQRLQIIFSLAAVVNKNPHLRVGQAIMAIIPINQRLSYISDEEFQEYLDAYHKKHR